MKYKCRSAMVSMCDMAFFLTLGVFYTLFYFNVIGNTSNLHCLVSPKSDQPVFYSMTNEP